jgi:RP/EB family microtubule-associated protein
VERRARRQFSLTCTGAFLRHGIERTVNVEQLVKCKMQDNLDFLQWSKKYWDQYFPGNEYDAVARRRGSGAPPAPRASTGSSSAGARAARSGGPSVATLNEENLGLRETVLGLERERDFYFSKLRDIELLIQEAVELDPEIEKDEEGLIKKVQTILYSTEDGFEIPAEAEEEQETF